MQSNNFLVVTVALVIFFFFIASAYAHNASTAYLRLMLGENNIAAVYKAQVLDINRLIYLDSNSDKQITWGELKSNKDKIFEALASRIHFNFDNQPEFQCQLAPKELDAEIINGGWFAVFQWQVSCGSTLPNHLRVTYDVLFDIDETHVLVSTLNDENPRLLTAENNYVEYESLVSNLNFPSKDAVTSQLQWSNMMTFLKEGIHHIFIGYDHILFLLTLLLAVFITHEKQIIRELLKVVTAFTVAHSITLFLVALSVIQLPSKFIESFIALSIGVAAFNNIKSFIPWSLMTTGFCFGLIHGFGFANVLADLQLDARHLVATVLSFNVGVELGQIVILMVFLPIFALLKRSKHFSPWIIRTLSSFALLAALLWLIERIFEIKIIS